MRFGPLYPGIVLNDERWGTFATVVKGFANRYRVLAGCYPGIDRRIGNTNKTLLRGGYFVQPINKKVSPPNVM